MIYSEPQKGMNGKMGSVAKYNPPMPFTNGLISGIIILKPGSLGIGLRIPSPSSSY